MRTQAVLMSVVFLAVSRGSDAAGQTLNEREFVDEFKKGCITTQVNDQRNRAFSYDALSYFCSCLAIHAVPLFTYSEVEAIGKTQQVPPSATAKLEQFTPQCIREMLSIR